MSTSTAPTGHRKPRPKPTVSLGWVNAGDPLTTQCPVDGCTAAAGEPCYDQGTGTRPQPHASREMKLVTDRMIFLLDVNAFGRQVTVNPRNGVITLLPTAAPQSTAVRLFAGQFTII